MKENPRAVSSDNFHNAIKFRGSLVLLWSGLPKHFSITWSTEFTHTLVKGFCSFYAVPYGTKIGKWRERGSRNLCAADILDISLFDQKTIYVSFSSFLFLTWSTPVLLSFLSSSTTTLLIFLLGSFLRSIFLFTHLYNFARFLLYLLYLSLLVSRTQVLSLYFYLHFLTFFIFSSSHSAFLLFFRKTFLLFLAYLRAIGSQHSVASLVDKAKGSCSELCYWLLSLWGHCSAVLAELTSLLCPSVVSQNCFCLWNNFYEVYKLQTFSSHRASEVHSNTSPIGKRRLNQ